MQNQPPQQPAPAKQNKPSQQMNSLTLVHATLNELQDDRDKWRSLCMKLGTSNAVTAGILVLVVAVFIFYRPASYFATSPTGQIIPIVPLDKPTVTSVAVQRFAVTTISEALSLNFRQWRGQLANVEPNFTATGYKSFLEEIEKTKWVKRLEEGYFTASVTEISRPVLVAQGTGANGVYGYVVEIPMTLTLENQTERRRQEMKARVVIVRVPTAEKPDGIAVDKVFVS